MPVKKQPAFPPVATLLPDDAPLMYIPKSLRPDVVELEAPNFSGPVKWCIGIELPCGPHQRSMSVGVLAGMCDDYVEFLEYVPLEKETAAGTVSIIRFQGNTEVAVYSWDTTANCWVRRDDDHART